MWDRVKLNATDGLVLGVKWAVVGLVLFAALSVVLGDYVIVRQRAANGQQAWEVLQRMQQSQTSSPTEPKR